MIIYNKNIFLANDKQWKVWIQDNYDIFWLKDRRKGIMVLDFFLF